MNITKKIFIENLNLVKKHKNITNKNKISNINITNKIKIINEKSKKKLIIEAFNLKNNTITSIKTNITNIFSSSFFNINNTNILNKYFEKKKNQIGDLTKQSK